MPKPSVHIAHVSTNNLIEKPIYKLAIDIFAISRSVATHISNNKNILAMSRSRLLQDVFSTNITLYSLKLIEYIGLVESAKNKNTVSEYLSQIENIISSLKAHCERYEINAHKDQDIIFLLRSELEKFKNLFWHWVPQVKKNSSS